MAVANNQDPCLTGATPQTATITHQPQAPKSWVDMMEDESPEWPPLFRLAVRMQGAMPTLSHKNPGS